MAKLTDKQLQEKQYELAHLNLDFSKVDWDQFRDPFSKYYSRDHYMEILKAIRDPKNFFFTCKYILNKEPTVFQLVWLDQLWNYSFPLLIASRGASKSFTLGLYFALRATITQGCKIVIAAPTFRQSKLVFDYIEDIWKNSPVWQDLCGRDSGPSHQADMYQFRIGRSTITAIPLGNGEKIRGLRANYVDVEEFNCLSANTLCETDLGLVRIKDLVENKKCFLVNKDGQYEEPIRYIRTPTPVDVYEVNTEGGYTFKCSAKHKVLTTRGFKLAIELNNDDCIISENKYKFPTDLIQIDDLIVDENLAWLFGILVSEGDINNKNYFRVKTTDYACANKIKNAILAINQNQHITWCEREPYINKQWNCECKKTYSVSACNQKLRDKFELLGLDRAKVYDKKIPWSVLQSPRNVVIKFLSALFDGDGSISRYKNYNGVYSIRMCYHTVSKQLADEVKILTKKLGYYSTLRCRTKNRKTSIYEITFNGFEAYKLAKELDIYRFNLLLEDCNEKTMADHPTIYYDKHKNNFQIHCRMHGKNKKIGVRKTYEEALQLYNENNIEHLKVKSVTKLPEQEILYDIEVPLTHSFYGNGMVQHNSIDEEVFEVVLKGFTATSSNPVENIKREAKLAYLKERGLLTPIRESEITGSYKSNQIILSGTTGWDFQPFAKRWRKYRDIIKSNGDLEKLKQLGIPFDSDLSHKDYTIIRIPVELLPKGMMDAKAIASARANDDPARYNLEYGAVFSKDSNGFFPRSLIESCVTKEPIAVGNSQVQFAPRMQGDPAGRYIMGIDPASESDNFAIVILENFPTHNRVVYCWTVRRKTAFKDYKDNKTDENNFYGFIAKKIRQLMNSFNIEYISMDSQGGGLQVMEALHDIKRLEPGEVAIWPLRKDDEMFYPGNKDYGYDDEQGLHILEMVSMSNGQFVSEINHGMRKDLMNKMLLFPHVDAVTLELASMVDLREIDKVDTLQNNIFELEELKDELSTIILTTTLNGRDKFDTPATILPGGRKGKLRKDRYSALSYANGMARRLFRQSTIDYSCRAIGGFTNQFQNQEVDGPMYIGPDDFVKWANQSVLGVGASRSRSDNPFDYYHQALNPIR